MELFSGKVSYSHTGLDVFYLSLNLKSISEKEAVYHASQWMNNL